MRLESRMGRSSCTVFLLICALIELNEGAITRMMKTRICPDSVPSELTLSAFSRLFNGVSFERCLHHAFEASESGTSLYCPEQFICAIDLKTQLPASGGVAGVLTKNSSCKLIYDKSQTSCDELTSLLFDEGILTRLTCEFDQSECGHYALVESCTDITGGIVCSCGPDAHFDWRTNQCECDNRQYFINGKCTSDVCGGCPAGLECRTSDGTCACGDGRPPVPKQFPSLHPEGCKHTYYGLECPRKPSGDEIVLDQPWLTAMGRDQACNGIREVHPQGVVLNVDAVERMPTSGVFSGGALEHLFDGTLAAFDGFGWSYIGNYDWIKINFPAPTLVRDFQLMTGEYGSYDSIGIKASICNSTSNCHLCGVVPNSVGSYEWVLMDCGGETGLYLFFYKERATIHQSYCVTDPEMGYICRMTWSIAEIQFPAYDEDPCLVCSNGQQVHPDFLCDGHDDCGDNWDETGCEVECGNGLQLHSHLLCDGHDDCGDNSDETGCYLECDDGQMVDVNKFHDGTPDCADGSDEYAFISDPDACEYWHGNCLNIRGVQQSEGTEALAMPPGARLDDCLEACLAYWGATGCEAGPDAVGGVTWCRVHTENSVQSNDSSPSTVCWNFGASPGCSQGCNKEGCVLPFTYYGQQFDSCANVTDDLAPIGYSWCATEVDVTGVFHPASDRWKKCCPDDSPRCCAPDCQGTCDDSWCVFPFSWREETFHSVTTYKSDSGRFWCATQVDREGRTTQWEYTCPSSCPYCCNVSANRGQQAECPAVPLWQ